MMYNMLFRLFLPYTVFVTCKSSQMAGQLMEDLLYWYMKDVRPVKNGTDTLEVGFGASLIRIIQVDEVNQVLTTNLWLEMQWIDHKLIWDPSQYDGITKLHISSDQIWTPDIVLYNNAHGNPDISVLSHALVFYDGRVIWKPPGIYNSFCEFDIERFPYDSQICTMKFGGWSHNQFYLDIYQIPIREGDQVVDLVDVDGTQYQYLEHGMDISYFYESAEWDLMNLTSRRNEKVYPGCCGMEIYTDVTFTITLARKPLFFTVNLVMPCMLIAILTTFVFYIPASDHKIGFSVGIFVTLSVFLIILIDLIPPTSLVIPLFGKYLLFTMTLVGLSIVVTVWQLSVFYEANRPMSAWMRWLFAHKLPPTLYICTTKGRIFKEEPDNRIRRWSPCFDGVWRKFDKDASLLESAQKRGLHPLLIQQLIENICHISYHFMELERQQQISDEWCFVGLVIDRLFLILFSLVNIIGTLAFVLYGQSLYGSGTPLTKQPISKPLGGEFWYNYSTQF